MPKKYSVTPRRPVGRATFVANFYNFSGQRVTRSLDTANEDTAKSLCQGLVTLRNAGVKTEADALALETFVDPGALPLFFGETAGAKDGVIVLPAAIVKSLARLSALDPDAKATVDTPQAIRDDLANFKSAVKILRTHVGTLKNEIHTKSEELATLGRTALAHAAKAAAGAPAIAEARAAYVLHLKSTVKKRDTYTRVLDRFSAYLGAKFPAISNVGDVMPGHIMGFLDEETNIADETKKATRRRSLRTYIGVFFNWCAQQYHIVSPMSGVKRVKNSAVRRERGEIAWHSLEEIRAALAQLPARAVASLPRTKKSDVIGEADFVYWRALIGTLAFAGLQLAELCWLRLEDLKFSKKGTRATLWVTTVPDPGDPDVRHLLKTDNRQRHVDVHPRYLLPLLSQHLASGRAGPYFLFPMPAKRKRKGFAEQGARWKEITLSTFLRGHPGGTKRKPTLGLLPEGMNAKSLRRTFGSLLIRSGKSTEQVAAAMGNTPAVVREHYARILGCEVDVDF